MTDKEKIAKNAASTWCRCFKCDGIVNSTHEKCEKDKLLTCHKWYDGYRTALLAISDYEQQLMAKAVKVNISNASEETIDKVIGWIEELNNNNIIIRYSDSCEPPLSELTEWFKDYMKGE